VRALCFTTVDDVELLGVAFRGRIVAVYARDGAAAADAPWEPHPLAAWQAHDAMIETAAFVAPGVLATGSRDGTVRLWDAFTGAPRGAPLAAGAAVQGVAALPRGRLAVALLDGRLQRWELTGARAEAESATGLRRLTAFAAVPERGLVAAAGADGLVVAVDPDRLDPLWTERLPTAWVTALAAAPGGAAALAAGGGDGTVWLLDPAVGDVLATHVPRGRLAAPAVALAFAPDGTLAALHGGASVALWRAAVPNAWTLLARFALRPDLGADLRAALGEAAARADPRPLDPWLHHPDGSPYRDPGAAAAPELVRRLQAAVRRAEAARPRTLPG